MSRRFLPLILAAIVLAAASLYIGCDQADDVFTNIYKTELRLEAERLPSNPAGMIYTIWAANDSTGDTTYIDKFGYDQASKKYLDAAGAVRADGNLFVMEGDLYDWTHIFVSIDTLTFSPSDPGPIMLIDEVQTPFEDVLQMRFPLVDSLWDATVRYNMETTSDGLRNAQDGYGIWFASYRVDSVRLQDTFALASFVLDSVVLDDIGDKTDTTSVMDVDSIHTETIKAVYGLDTVEVVKTFYKFIYFTDSVPPYVVYQPEVTFSVGATSWFRYDQFTQDDFGMIDYTSYGWKYRGWVVSEGIDGVNTHLTPPAWLYKSDGFTWIPGETGGMVTTGTFGDISLPDDSNPYGDSQRIPPYPGEDFLTGPEGTEHNLLDGAGTAFITLEPENFNDNTTNFPLFVMIDALPDIGAVSQTNVSETMKGWTQSSDPWHGFPAIGVDVKRY